MEREILCAEDLIAAIKTYNNKGGNFSLLRTFFISEATLDERIDFFDSILPKMQKMMINMPNVITVPPRLLKSGKNFSVYMSQEQCAYLMVAAFFCTFPRNVVRNYTSEKPPILGIKNNLIIRLTL